MRLLNYTIISKYVVLPPKRVGRETDLGRLGELYDCMGASQWGRGPPLSQNQYLSILHFGWGKWVIYISVLDKMGAAAE